MKRRITSIVVTACALALSIPINATTKTPTESVADTFTNEFSKLVKHWHYPGGAVAVVKNSQVIYAKGFGYANLDTKEPVTPASIFRLASVSKAITAVAIMTLVERDELQLSDKAFHILDDLKPIKGRNINPKIYQITVHDLLAMSSGWITRGEGRFDPMYGPWPNKVKTLIGEDNLPASCQTMVSMMMTFPLHFKPGSQFSYSNLDYCALGLIINKKAYGPYTHHHAYETYIKTQVLDPLNLTSMSIGSTTPGEKEPLEVSYYNYQGPYPPKNLSTYLPYGDNNILKNNFSNGGWSASIIDLAKFANAVANYKVISKKSVETILARPKFVNKKADRYFGLGWRVKYINGKRYWYATGSYTGTNALVINRPDGSTVAAVFNARPPPYELFYRFRPQLFNLMVNAKFD